MLIFAISIFRLQRRLTNEGYKIKMNPPLKIKGRLRSIGEPGRKGTMLTFSVLTFDKVTDDIKALLSKRVMLFNFAEATDHAEQAPLPLPVVEGEKSAPQLITIPGQPIGKPRQTQRDKWQQRPCVVAYRLWADRARIAARGKIPEEIEGVVIRFFFAMPNTWDSTKRLHHDGKPHEQKPDIDNCVKSVLDSLLDNDEIISRLEARKIWTNGDPRTEVYFV